MSDRTLKEILGSRTVYTKRYKVRTVGKHSLQVVIPREAFEKAARAKDLTFKEAVKKLKAVWRYGEFPGLILTFEEGEEAAEES